MWIIFLLLFPSSSSFPRPLPPSPLSPLFSPSFLLLFYSCASQIFHNFWKVFWLLLSSVLFLHHFLYFLHLQVNRHMSGLVYPSFLTSVEFFYLMLSLLFNADNFFRYLFLFLKCLFNYVYPSFSVYWIHWLKRIPIIMFYISISSI